MKFLALLQILKFGRSGQFDGREANTLSGIGRVIQRQDTKALGSAGASRIGV